MSTEADSPTPGAPRVIQVVALIGAGGQFGGPASVAMGLTAELQARGRDVSLMALESGAVTRPTGVSASRWQLSPARRFVPGAGMLGLFNVRLLVRLWRAVRPGTVVHVHAGRDLVSLAALGVAVLRGATVVAQTHGMVRPRDSLAVRLFDLVLLRLLDRARVLLYLTDAERADLVLLMGESPALRFLGNGLAITAPALRTPGPPRVVFASRLHPVKGVLTFAAAAKLVLETGAVADLVAYGSDQGDLPAFLEAASDPDLAGRLRYGGALDHATTTRVIADADVFVLPSAIDWMPMSLLEAMAAGVATVSTSSCGLAGVIEEAQAGLVVDGDTESVAAAIVRLLSDSELRISTGERGRDLVSRRFSITAVVDELETIYAAAALRPPGR